MHPPSSTTPARARRRGPAAWARLAAVVCFAATACASGSGGATESPAGSAPPAASAPEDRPAEAARPDTTEAGYSDADVAFMRGMIHHHAQAVVMARMAPERAESPAVRRLTARILNSQKTEIGLMADWLRDRGEPVPEIAARVERSAQREAPDPGGEGDDAAGEGGADDDATGGIAPPGGWDAGMQMPGLLSDEQMLRLEAARGREFDRLFLTWMIDHHQGAVTMVKNLVRSPGGAREESVFRLASGIRADQATEIDRMRTMLGEILFGGDGP